LVVGENLGVVPDAIRGAIPEYGLYDTPTLRGFWEDYPNWQRKLPRELEELKKQPDLTAQFADIARARDEVSR
jgi:4-alpha-glucanotransferase